MVRSIFAILVLILLLTAAKADCVFEAEKAEATFSSSDPFEFEYQYVHSRGSVTGKECGRIIPDIGYEIGGCDPKIFSPVNLVSILSERAVGRKVWWKDNFGWKENPSITVYQQQHFMPLLTPRLVNGRRLSSVGTKRLSATCETTSSVDGYPIRRIESELSGYGNLKTVEVLHVDPTTGRLKFYDMREVRNGQIIRTVKIAYRFDQSIRIEQPVIDLEDRQHQSRLAFEKDKMSGDEACRQKLSQAINFSNQHPFRFTTRQMGIFSPEHYRGVHLRPDVYLIYNPDYKLGNGSPFAFVRNGQQGWQQFRPINEANQIMPLEPVSLSSESFSWINDSKSGLLLNDTFVGQTKCLADREIRFRRFELRDNELWPRGGRVLELDEKNRIKRIIGRGPTTGKDVLESNVEEERTYNPDLDIPRQ